MIVIAVVFPFFSNSYLLGVVILGLIYVLLGLGLNIVVGLAGVFFATYQGFVNPTSFTFFESALILAIVVLGGMGSTIGVVIAAFVLTVAPELLRGFAEYRVLLFGILMVLMMIWRPRGLIRISRTGVTPVSYTHLTLPTKRIV